MLRPCLICDDGFSPRLEAIGGQKIRDFQSLPELAMAMVQNEITEALKTLENNYNQVLSEKRDTGWAKFCAMSSRDAVDYLNDLLPEVATVFNRLFRGNQDYQQNASPLIDQLVSQFANQVQHLDEQYGVRYSKSESCPIWLLKNTMARHLSKAIDYTIKWGDGSYISVVSAKTYPRLCSYPGQLPDGLQVDVHKLGPTASDDRIYARDIRLHLDYRDQGRALYRVYNPPVLDSFTGVLAEWVRYNTTLGANFWQQQIEIYEQAFLPILDELFDARDELKKAEEKPVLVERYGAAKLNYAFARLKAEVMLESYQTYFRQVEHATHHIINCYDYYPRFIGDDFFFNRYCYDLDDSPVPMTPYDVHTFCERLDELDQDVLFSKARHPTAGILYDVCFGFKSDHSGFQLILPDSCKDLEYHFYNWSDYDDFSVFGTEQISIYNAILVSEFSPYMTRDRLPAGLQDKLDQFKDFHL